MEYYTKEETNEINDFNRKINDLNHMISNLIAQRDKFQADLDAVCSRIIKRNEKKNA